MAPDDDLHAAYLDPILDRYGYAATNLLQILREVQECYGHIHPAAIDYLAAKLQIPRARIESVASG